MLLIIVHIVIYNHYGEIASKPYARIEISSHLLTSFECVSTMFALFNGNGVNI